MLEWRQFSPYYPLLTINSAKRELQSRYNIFNQSNNLQLTTYFYNLNFTIKRGATVKQKSKIITQKSCFHIYPLADLPWQRYTRLDWNYSIVPSITFIGNPVLTCVHCVSVKGSGYERVGRWNPSDFPCNWIKDVTVCWRHS